MDELEMMKAAREAHNAYNREWRKKNPEKVKAAQQRYWIKKVEQMKREQEQTDGTEHQ